MVCITCLLCELCEFECLVNSIGKRLNTRVEKISLLVFEKMFWAEQSRNKRKKKKFWTVLQFLNNSRLGIVEFWKIIPVFAQGKEL